MRILSKVFWMAMLLILLPMVVQAQEALLKNLYSQVFKLYNQGRYSEAADIANKALKVAEDTFGKEHPNVAISLNNLAYLYDCQSNYAKSEPLYKRALAILEKALGPENFRVGCVLSNMAERFRNMGRKDEADTLEARAVRIQSRH